MKNLTPTQTKVMNHIHKQINQAKAHETYESYVNANYNKKLDWQIEAELKDQTYKKYWENNLNNIALTETSTNTLRALEKKGYIEILKVGIIDTVKLLK